MKKVAGIVFVMIFILSGTQFLYSEEKSQGFSEFQVNEDTNFETYDLLYLERINVEGVLLPSSDIFYDNEDESGGILSEDTEKEELEFKYRKIFGKTLNKVIPVTYRRIEEKDKREMVLLIKIEGEIKETRFLENILPVGKNREVMVGIEGVLVDQATGEELVKFRDEYRSEKRPEEESVFDEDDREEWAKAVNLWAKSLAVFLAQKRRHLYAFSE